MAIDLLTPYSMFLGPLLALYVVARIFGYPHLGAALKALGSVPETSVNDAREAMRASPRLRRSFAGIMTVVTAAVLVYIAACMVYLVHLAFAMKLHFMLWMLALAIEVLLLLMFIGMAGNLRFFYLRAKNGAI